MEKLIKKPTQEQRILKVLEDAEGEWINGQYFIRTMMITQYHARIFSLQKSLNTEASSFTDEHGFKSYRLLPSVAKESNLFDLKKS